jgi:nitrite reductase/ring-hydroxylating ferredoxin subunit|tara:strand:- start:1 stop:336 length:336 start_codon:yes stop_codon:yes gene_type:complete
MQPLCSVFDIPDGGSNGFFAETSDGRFLYIAVRQKDEVYVYKNSCPHMGMPLDFRPGLFLTADSSLIQCSAHGAKFNIKDGLCVSGPCKGDYLISISTKIIRGIIYLNVSN